ncbi:MAG TPA: hypothetical protein VKA27_08615 [Sunxiuqinia sp.]|nr:hypothetical protein [Sunxiuqinia sp.]
MTIKALHDDLIDNEWTSILVNKARTWENFGRETGIHIEGDYSSYHCQFSGEMKLNGGLLKISGHRNFVDVPIGLDKYVEVFTLEYTQPAAVPISSKNVKVYRRGLIGGLLFSFSGMKRHDLGEKLLLGYMRYEDLQKFHSIEIHKLKKLESLTIKPAFLKAQYGTLFDRKEELEQIKRIIDNLKMLSA